MSCPFQSIITLLLCKLGNVGRVLKKENETGTANYEYQSEEGIAWCATHPIVAVFLLFILFLDKNPRKHKASDKAVIEI